MSLPPILDRVSASADMTELPSSLVMRIAQRLESAISRAKQSEARDLAADLRAVVSLLLGRVEPDVRTAVRGGSAADLSLRQAYSLGKASFAQGLAEQMAERREADNFLEYLNSRTTRPYVQALLHRSLNGQELAAATGREEESVSRKLKELRERRITDFRKEGRNIINFLTPAARAALTANKELIDEVAEQRSGAAKAREITRSGRAQLPPILRHSPRFVRSGTADAGDGGRQ
jgi:DNA-binding transcriptional ArsR family regulator